MIELLIVVAIIGIIAAVVIPNLLDGLQKAKQKRAMGDMHLVGTAWMSWLSDQASSAAAGRSTGALYEWETLFADRNEDQMSDLLVPQYAAAIPLRDPWGHDYEYGAGTDPINSPRPFGVRSTGADGAFDDSYLLGPFVTTDYEQDIVWVGGFFVRWPAGATSVSGGS